MLGDARILESKKQIRGCETAFEGSDETAWMSCFRLTRSQRPGSGILQRNPTETYMRISAA
jgi:hypothetical protein